MKTEQKKWSKNSGWESISNNKKCLSSQLVFIFGDREILKNKSMQNEIKNFYPHADFIGCSTAGEIIGDKIYDNSLTLTAVYFEKTELRFSKIKINDMRESYNAGAKLIVNLPKNNLKHIFVLSNGLNINGSDLTQGIIDNLPKGVTVTGGLAGDQDKFQETIVLLNDDAHKNNVACVAFYSDNLKIGYGSMGGWTSFGIDRLVTKSKDNILYELDGKPALDLYKKYLGKQADGLPATGLLFPLSIILETNKNHLVRTILGIDNDKGSMTFAGNITQGSYVRLMKANFEQLVQGAYEAAKISANILGDTSAELAILISCVGRKLILKQRIEEETEIVKEKFGQNTHLTGFYSYGEICPFDMNNKKAELHNQTMTITVFAEN